MNYENIYNQTPEEPEPAEGTEGEAEETGSGGAEEIPED